MAHGLPIAIREIGDNAHFARAFALGTTPLIGRTRVERGVAAHRTRLRTEVFTVTDCNTLADRIEDLLPQTQCTKCGYAGCRPYAQAVADGVAGYNQCPPGGAQGVARLAALLGKPVIPLNPDNGAERPRPLAVIDETLCIGCTLCMQACPVDAIVGAPKLMHTVLAERCTGCDLCVAPCPVDCIDMVPVTGDATGWDAWTQDEADAARRAHDRRIAREARERAAREARLAARQAAAAPASASPAAAGPSDADAAEQKRAIIAAALERARQKKAALAAQGVAPKNTEHVSAAVQAQIDEAQARRARAGLSDADAGTTPQPTTTGPVSDRAPKPAPKPAPNAAPEDDPA